MNSNAIIQNDGTSLLVNDEYGPDLGLATQSTPKPIVEIKAEGLRKALEAYTESLQQQEICQSRYDSAKESENIALGSELDDSEIVDRISLAQNQQKVYAARIESGKRNAAKLLKTLEIATSQARSEFHQQLRALHQERSDILEGRLIKVLQPGEEFERIALLDLIEVSRPISVLRDISLGSYLQGGEHAVTEAEATLSAFERLDEERKVKA